MKHVLLWDFFGDEARRTAEHFRTHLQERLVKEGFTAETAMLSERPGQCGVLCRCDVATADALERLLRPQGRADADAVEAAYPDAF